MPVIIVNTALIVKIYVLKEDFPAVCGRFPLISLEEEADVGIKKGDLIICERFDGGGRLDGLSAGMYVTHFSDAGHTAMCISRFVAFEGDRAVLYSPADGREYVISAREIVGKYGFSIPLLGYVIHFLSTIPGFLLCVVFPTAILTEVYLYRRKKTCAQEDDEEAALLAELCALKAEKERLSKPRDENKT